MAHAKSGYGIHGGFDLGRRIRLRRQDCRDQIKGQAEYEKVDIAEFRGDRCGGEYGKKQGNARQIADQSVVVPADDGDADAEKQNPAGDAHAPERAVDGHHAAKFNGDFLCLDDQRTADQRCV